MVDVRIAYDTFTLPDGQDEKEKHLFDSLTFDNILSVKVYPVADSAGPLNGGQSTKRTFNIVAEYEAGVSNIQLFTRVQRVTTTNTTTPTIIEQTNNARNTLVSLEAVPISQKDDKVEYILFFFSYGGANGVEYDIYSKRLPVVHGDIDNGIIMDVNSTNLEYTTNSFANTVQNISYYDVFTATPTE